MASISTAQHGIGASQTAQSASRTYRTRLSLAGLRQIRPPESRSVCLRTGMNGVVSDRVHMWKGCAPGETLAIGVAGSTGEMNPVPSELRRCSTHAEL